MKNLMVIIKNFFYNMFQPVAHPDIIVPNQTTSCETFSLERLTEIYLNLNLKIRTDNAMTLDLVEHIELVIENNLQSFNKIKDSHDLLSTPFKRFRDMVFVKLPETVESYLKLNIEDRETQLPLLLESLDNWYTAVDRLVNICDNKNEISFEVDAEVNSLKF